MKKLICILLLISRFGFTQTKPSRFPAIQDDNKTVGTNTTNPVVTQNPTTGVYEKVPRNYFATQLQLSNVKTLINTTTGNNTDSALIINSIPFYADKIGGNYKIKLGEKVGLNSSGLLFGLGYEIGANSSGLIFGFGNGIGNENDLEVVGFGYSIGNSTYSRVIGFGKSIGNNTGNIDIIGFGNEIGNYSTGNLLQAFGNNIAMNNSGNLFQAFGYFLGENNTGNINTVFGSESLNNNDGSNNISFGRFNLNNNFGNNLISIGSDNFKSNLGNDNIAIGQNAITYNNTFSNIIALGNSCKPSKDKQLILSASDLNGSFRINLDIPNSVTVNPPSSSGTMAILSDIPAPVSLATTTANGLMSIIDKVKLNNLLENNENEITYFSDFIGGEGSVFSASAGIGGGQANNFSAEINHNGILRFIQNNANAGYSFTTNISNIQIIGNETFTAIFRPQTLYTVTFRAGFHNTITPTDATNGIYFEFNNSGSLFFKTANNSIRSTSSIVANLVLFNWYKLKITVNSGATSVLGQVYDSLGVLIGSQTLTTNIPSLAGRQVGTGVIATRATAGTGVPLIDLDYLKINLKPVR